MKKLIYALLLTAGCIAPTERSPKTDTICIQYLTTQTTPKYLGYWEVDRLPPPETLVGYGKGAHGGIVRISWPIFGCNYTYVTATPEELETYIRVITK